MKYEMYECSNNDQFQFSQVHCSHLRQIFRKFTCTENGSCEMIKFSKVHYSYLTKFSDKIHCNYRNSGKLFCKSPNVTVGCFEVFASCFFKPGHERKKILRSE